MEMHVVIILSLLLLIGFPEAYTLVTDTDREERQQQPFTLSDNIETGEISGDYSNSYKQAIKQLETYIRKESENLDLKNEVQPKNNQHQYIDGTNEITKRPFVMTGHLFGKRQHDLNTKAFIEDIGNQFAELKDGEFDDVDMYPANGHLVHNPINDDNEALEENKRPFVMNHFGKRSFIHNGKRPFTFSFGKRFSNEASSTKSESPFAIRKYFGPGNVEKQSHLTDEDSFEYNNGEQPTLYGDITVERKRPFVFSSGHHFGSGYKFGKRSFDKMLNEKDIPLNREEFADPDERQQGSVNLSDHIENVRRVEKRPFVIFGGYDTNKKSAENVYSYPYHRIIGSGFRFGKRQHWDKFGTSPDTKVNKPSEAGDKEIGSVLPIDSRYMVAKRPFVIGGIYHRHAERPIYIHNAWKLPMIVGSGFRFGKRNAGGRINGLHRDLKRHFFMNFDKSEHRFPQMPEQYEKRYFTFRNDYHFGKLRDSYKVPVDKRPMYLERFGKKQDQSGVYENMAGHSDADNMEFNALDVPGIPLMYNTVKRPFVLGSGRGYKFGK